MAKDKSTKVAAAAAPKVSKTDAVKTGRVTKPADKAKAASKETAKKAVKNVESKKSKKVKEPTPEPSSDEEDDATSASSDSSESDDSADEKPNGAKFEADSSSEEESAEDSDDETPVVKTNGAKVNGASKNKVSKDSDSEDSSDDEEDAPAAAAAADADSDSSDSEDEDEEKETEVKDSRKRKADDSAAPSAKKTKYTVNGEEKEATANLWVGQLSWNVDDEWLSQEFQGFGEIVQARVMTERDSGRSKGFGYVEFTNAEDAGKALEARQGHEIDGRQIRVDFSTPRDTTSNPQQKSFDRAKKFGDSQNPPSNTLFVGNLAFGVDQGAIGEVFQEYGSVNGVRLPTDRDSGEPKGYGYVEMSSIEEAQAAIDALQGADVSGRPMRLDFAGARPERTDGGFGGRGGRGGGFRGGRGGFGDRGGRGGRGRGGFGDRGGRGGGFRGGRGGTTNRGGFGDFSGKKMTF